MWNVEDLRNVDKAMEDLEVRCEEILQFLADKKRLSAYERDHIRELYTTLKADLREAYKRGTISTTRRAQTRAESAFFHPAVHRAMVDLRPATNTNPLTSRWAGPVWEAKGELSYYRHNLAKLLPAP